MLILIPNNFVPERTYIVNELIGNFLGLDFQIQKKNNLNEIIILLNNSNRIIIKDYFFSNFKNEKYLDIKNIPEKISYTKNKYIVENNIPIIYGKNQIDESHNKIICHIDIFASSFFMLTRWEEFVVKKYDIYNRFDSNQSLAFKHGFLKRPIVNEYVDMLWLMLKKIAYSEKRKHRKFNPILTHDIDIHLRWRNVFQSSKSLIADIVKRKSINLFFSNAKSCIKSFVNRKNDPYNTYDFLMNLSEKIGAKSYFFFMSGGGKFKDENFYNIKSKFIKKLINHINNRGHYIGLHPSYYSYNNFDILEKELNTLSKLVKKKISFTRQHYLRFEVPLTWQILNKLSFEWDSSMYYADNAGFRCGVCYEFNVFDILERKKLSLKEKPIIVMETSYLNKKESPQNTEIQIIDIMNKVKKYNGEFVLLWHNSTFNDYISKPYTSVYNNVINLIYNEK